MMMIIIITAAGRILNVSVMVWRAGSCVDSIVVWLMYRNTGMTTGDLSSSLVISSLDRRKAALNDGPGPREKRFPHLS
jgi:hypothetical protein